MSVHLDQVQRWLQAGGTYEVLTDRDGVVVIALFTCSGDEEMARLCSSEPDLIAFVRG
jgi:hypothetical protein